MIANPGSTATTCWAENWRDNTVGFHTHGFMMRSAICRIHRCEWPERPTYDPLNQVTKMECPEILSQHYISDYREWKTELHVSTELHNLHLSPTTPNANTTKTFCSEQGIWLIGQGDKGNLGIHWWKYNLGWFYHLVSIWCERKRNINDRPVRFNHHVHLRRAEPPANADRPGQRHHDLPVRCGWPACQDHIPNRNNDIPDL